MSSYTVHSEHNHVNEEGKYSAYNTGFEPDKVTIEVSNQNNGNVESETETGADDRGGWGNKIEFVLAIVGYAVGLGNVWRFPYLAQKNGGGAFLIPYIISLALMGIPVFFMELAIGQRLRKGPLHVWNKLSPLLTGVGLSSVIVSFLVGCYYNMIVAWCFYYLFISFQKNIPYAKCPCIGTDTCTNKTLMVKECADSSATTYYWYRGALGITSSIDESGGLNWKLTLCLLLAWALLFFITCKGTESMGKTVYFTAIFPYVVLIIFFVRAVLLDGAWDGIKHMFTPEFGKLSNPQVWLEASTQIFYSLGLAFGGLISMASYNQINNNIIRDALLVSVVNCGTSIFAGIVIFGILGYKAKTNYKLCLELQKIDTSRKCDLKEFLDDVAQGTGLTFIAFTEAMSTMDVTQLWSVMFFMMLLTLGIGSMLGTYEAVRTTVVDLKIIPVRKEFVSLILCIISFCFGLLFCQGSGEYWLQMFNDYSANVGLLTIALFELIIIMYIYGYKKFANDIEFMLGKKPNIYWKATWLVITPVLTIGIIIASLYGLFTGAITYTKWDKESATTQVVSYPAWGKAICVILILASVVFIPITAILVKYNIFKIPGEDKDLPKTEMKNIGKSESTMPLKE